ncbi:MAG: Ig-like domain-containing protein [Bacteroidales bacterium]
MKKASCLSGTLAAALFLCAASCAKMMSPSGGSKDVDPPIVVRSIPEIKSLYFNSKTILVTFNEYVTFDRLNEKFMISPPMEQKPAITLRGKTMRIEFLEKLKDSTTYTLYFQDAIRDLNEGNPLVNYQFVFSTGNYLDSLSVTGNILLASNLNPEKNVLVMITGNLADSAPKKKLPDYLIIADENGYFRINNIKSGKYRLYGLVDNNNNKLYDLQDELFAFYDQVLDINPATNYISPRADTMANAEKKDTLQKAVLPEGVYKLFLFTAPMKKYYLTSSSRNMPYQLLFTLSRSPDTLEFDIISGNKKDFLIERNANKDTMTVWLLDSLQWSQQEIKTYIKYPFTDTTGKVVYRIDTIPMRYFAVKPAKRREQGASFNVRPDISGGTLKPGHRIMFSSSIPLLYPDTSKVRLYRVEKDKRTGIPFVFFPDTTTSLKYYLNAGLTEAGQYLLITDRGAFRNIYGDISDSTGYNFTVKPENSFGHLTMNLKNGTGKMIVQLLDKNEKLVAEQKLENSGQAIFPLLERGNYRVRVIYDLNGDGHWTTGDYDLKLQPEPVSYYPDEIEVKTDWRIEQEWDVGRMNEKSRALKNKKTQ